MVKDRDLPLRPEYQLDKWLIKIFSIPFVGWVIIRIYSLKVAGSEFEFSLSLHLA
jgi:hypothetical protein